MHYKTIYILLLISSLYSQSFFNRVVPEQLYFNDAKSMAIGQTMISTGNGSGMIISNPARLSNHKEGLYIDVGFDFSSISERRSIIFKDEWEEALGETDYVFNQNNYFNNSFGFIYNIAISNSEKISFAFSKKPYLSMNYNYEEEIRGASNLDDGIIGIRDPIVGYQVYNTSGNIDIRSFGFSYSTIGLENNISFGFGFNKILDTTISHEFNTIIVDNTYGTENLSLIDDSKSSYLLVSENTFKTFGMQIPIAKEVVLNISYEESMKIADSNSSYSVNILNSVGLPQLFEFSEDDSPELTYLMSGLVYQKPQKKNVGLTYHPKSNINMMLALEISNKSWTMKMDGMDNSINEYKLGFEYAPYNSYPIRAGLVYKESVFDMIEPTSILTLGTGIEIGGVMGRVLFANSNTVKTILDLGMNYSTFSYKYIDIFPLTDIYSDNCDILNCDNVTENRLSFLTTIRMEF